jgi:toxin ParE1/3/4
VGIVRFSVRAEVDLLDISQYTMSTWGRDQTIRYLNGLEACCQQLAENPALGRPCDNVRPGLRRFEHGRHVIFYRLETGGIWVSRLLHERMMPTRSRLRAGDDT